MLVVEYGFGNTSTLYVGAAFYAEVSCTTVMHQNPDFNGWW